MFQLFKELHISHEVAQSSHRKKTIGAQTEIYDEYE